MSIKSMQRLEFKKLFILDNNLGTNNFGPSFSTMLLRRINNEYCIELSTYGIVNKAPDNQCFSRPDEEPSFLMAVGLLARYCSFLKPSVSFSASPHVISMVLVVIPNIIPVILFGYEHVSRQSSMDLLI